MVQPLSAQSDVLSEQLLLGQFCHLHHRDVLPPTRDDVRTNRHGKEPNQLDHKYMEPNKLERHCKEPNELDHFCRDAK